MTAQQFIVERRRTHFLQEELLKEIEARRQEQSLAGSLQRRLRQIESENADLRHGTEALQERYKDVFREKQALTSELNRQKTTQP